MSDAAAVVAREDDRTVEVAGHTCQMVAIENDEDLAATFECVDCGVRSNHVTLFDQTLCEDGDQR